MRLEPVPTFALAVLSIVAISQAVTIAEQREKLINYARVDTLEKSCAAIYDSPLAPNWTDNAEDSTRPLRSLMEQATDPACACGPDDFPGACDINGQRKLCQR